MATRIESGRIQIDAPGSVPMERIAPQQVDFMTAAREEARGAATMADIIDRMSTTVFGMAKEMAQEEAQKKETARLQTEALYKRRMARIYPKGKGKTQPMERNAYNV